MNEQKDEGFLARGKHLIQKIKNAAQDFLDENALSSKEEMGKSVIVYDGSFFNRLSYDFPKGKVLKISCIEAVDELVRVKKVLTNLCEANDIAYPDVKSEIDYSRKSSVAANENGICINLLFTKQLDENQLAFVLGHELGHYTSNHLKELSVFAANLDAINKELGDTMDNGMFMLQGLHYAHEFEADKLACAFAYKAGYKKIEDFRAIMGTFLEENIMMSARYGVSPSHPSNIERNMYYQSLHPETIQVNIKGRQQRVEEISRAYHDAEVNSFMHIKDRLSCFVKNEVKMMQFISPYVRLNREFFEKRMEKLAELTKEGKIKESFYTKGYENIVFVDTVKFLRDGETLPHRKQLMSEFVKINEVRQRAADNIEKSISISDRIKFYTKKAMEAPKPVLAKEVVRSCMISGKTSLGKNMKKIARVKHAIIKQKELLSGERGMR